MLPVLTFVAGLATGVFAALVAVMVIGDPRRAKLPPATRQQLDRAARANRPRLPARWVSPANADFDSEETK